MKKMEQESPGMVRAEIILEQARARYEEEKRKANAKRRKAENRHKYMMGGIIVKYFPDCYQYEESELNEILSAALVAAVPMEEIRAEKKDRKQEDAGPVCGGAGLFRDGEHGACNDCRK